MAKIMKENEEKRITLELYRKDGGFGIYIGSDGGSGITVEENTPMAVAQGIAAYIADLFYNEDDEEEEDEDDEINIENYKTYPLYRYDASAFDGSTIYFYFESEENNCLIFIEYWADEESVGDYWIPYSYDGTPIRGEEDCGEYLTEEQKEYFAQKCKEVIEKENNK